MQRGQNRHKNGQCERRRGLQEKQRSLYEGLARTESCVKEVARQDDYFDFEYWYWRNTLVQSDESPRAPPAGRAEAARRARCS